MGFVKVGGQYVGATVVGCAGGGARMGDVQVTIKLTGDEAMVLSHWRDPAPELSGAVDDPAV